MVRRDSAVWTGTASSSRSNRNLSFQRRHPEWDVGVSFLRTMQSLCGKNQLLRQVRSAWETFLRRLALVGAEPQALQRHLNQHRPLTLQTRA